MPIDLLCLDADDTLWHNMRHFDEAQRAFAGLVARFAAAGVPHDRLQQVEAANLKLYGYGAKGFTLSMIETAADLCGDALEPATVRALLAIGRDLLAHPVELLAGVAETLDALAPRVRLVLVTKGDLLHQETKLAASGLGDRFESVEIVSDKTADTYRRLFARLGVAPDRAAMAGDSLRSDILPALAAGAHAAWLPPTLSWAHEHGRRPDGHPRFAVLERFADLTDWIASR